MSIFLLDYETTSVCDIKLGAYRYASDPSTRILMFAIAKDDGEPLLWDYLNPSGPESVAAIAMLREAIETKSLIYAHHAQFECAVSKYRMLPDLGLEPPAIEQWRCTAVMCRSAAIPFSLGDAAAILKLDVAKDTRGKALIKVFSDQTSVTNLRRGDEKMKSANPLLEDPIPWDWSFTLAGEPMTVRVGWEMFKSYCRQDVRVEQQVHTTMARFELTGAELDGFLFDLRLNERGVPVNVQALKHAAVIVDDHRGTLENEFNALTGLMPTQTGKVLTLLKKNGYPGGDLQAATMEAHLGHDGLTKLGRRVLEIRSQLSFAAVKKIPAMLATACQDDRMRGLFMFYGALRTGRWTSSGPQLQNAKKPTQAMVKLLVAIYQDICNGCDPEIFGFLYGNPYEAVASCIRNFIQFADGAMMLDLDLSNIESRVAAWLAGQDSLLQVYRDGRDPYKELASAIFGVDVKDVTKDQRFIGKTGNLSCCFQTSAKTFFEMCATWGQPISKKLACHAVKTFREVNDEFPKTWRRYEAGAVKAVKEPGQWVSVSDHVAFGYSRGKPFPRLMMRLPSGRCLCYPFPEVRRTTKRHKDFETGEVREWESDDLTFRGQMSQTKNWGRISTYGGDLFQSSVQATARDILLAGGVRAEREGFRIFSTIHDQYLAEDGDPAAFEAAICTHPDWLPEDFPLAAKCDRVPYYSKD